MSNRVNEFRNNVIKAQNGDMAAFDELIKMSQSKLAIHARSYVKNDSDALDILQNAYLRAYNKIESCEPDKWMAWMKEIVAREALTFLKSAHVRYDVNFTGLERTDDEGNVETYEVQDDVIEHYPELMMDYEEKKKILNDILDDLPDAQRVVLVKYYYEDKKIRDIAEELSINENTVKTHLRRGKNVLKEEVTEFEKKYDIRLACSPVAFFTFMLRDLEASYKCTSFIKGSQLLSGSVAAKSAATKAGETVTKTVAKKATKKAAQSAAKSVVTSVASKIAAVVVVGTLAVSTFNAINDKGFLNDTYNIDISGNANKMEVRERILDNYDGYEDNGTFAFMSTDVEDGGNAHYCGYYLDYGDKNYGAPSFAFYVDDRVFGVSLVNSEWGTIHPDLSGTPGHIGHEIQFNQKGAIIGFTLGVTNENQETQFDLDDVKPNEEKNESFRKIDWARLVADVEILRKTDNGIFGVVIDADELIRLFNDLDKYFNDELETEKVSSEEEKPLATWKSDDITIDTYTGFDVNDLIELGEGATAETDFNKETGELTVTVTKDDKVETYTVTANVINSDPDPKPWVYDASYITYGSGVTGPWNAYLTIYEDGTAIETYNATGETSDITAWMISYNSESALSDVVHWVRRR